MDTPAITNEMLTEGTLTGNGTFDILMQAVNVHLTKEYDSGRIKGAEYSTVYLGSVTQVLAQSVTFLLERDKRALELEILELQRLKAEAEIEKVREEIKLVQAQVALQEAQKPKIAAETRLLENQADNEVIKADIYKGQVCELQAKFDLLIEQKNKAIAETALLNQKRATETAQISGAGVDDNSVLGKQIKLYDRQSDGYLRDAEQKVAKMMIDTWNVRRTTDEGVTANTTNKLDDATLGSVVDKAIMGVGAST